MIININDITKANNEFSFKILLDDEIKASNYIVSDDLTANIKITKLGSFDIAYEIKGLVSYRFNAIDIKEQEINITETEEVSIEELIDDAIIVDEEIDLQKLIAPLVNAFLPDHLEFSFVGTSGSNWKVIDVDGYESELGEVKKANNPFNILKQED